MIHYKDRWWCADSDHCEKADGCDRVITPSEHEAAVRWWGSEDYPVEYRSGLDCYIPGDATENQNNDD